MVNHDILLPNWMHIVLEEFLISGFCFLSTKQKTAGSICLDITADEIQQKWSEEKIIQCGVP
jgi:hypothetical protein